MGREGTHGGSRTRWGLLLAWAGVQTVAVYLLGVVWMVLIDSRQSIPYNLSLASLEEKITLLWDWKYAVWMLGIATGILVLQAMLLWPVRKPAPVFRTQGRSVWWSFLAVGFVAACVWMGLAMGVYAGVNLIYELGWDSHWWSGWALLGSLLASWGVATPLLASYARGKRRERALSRIASAIFTGTVIEAVAVIPVDAMVRRKTDCYCGTGTFWTLTICATAGVVLLGPAVLLPALGRRRKRYYQSKCPVCGYDMSGNAAAERCPECGSGWKA